MMKNFFKIVLVVEGLLILLFFNNPLALLNTQLAFISSLLITLGSFWGYAKVVKSKTKAVFEEEESYFYLFEEDEDRKDLEAKDIFQQEKSKLKSPKRAILNFVKTAKGFFSPYRIGGYLFLTLVVLWLIRKGYFQVGAFLLGLGVVPLSVAILALSSSKRGA